MTTELTVLTWGCVLAVVHIFAAVQVKTRQYGNKWNIGARDEELPPPKPIVGRLARAQANFFETFPIMIAAVLIVSAAGIADNLDRHRRLALARRARRLSAALRAGRALMSLARLGGRAGRRIVMVPQALRRFRSPAVS